MYNFENKLNTLGEILLTAVKEYIEQVEKLNLTNTQWYIDWEMEMNKLTVKDHNKKPAK